eukprot:gene3138-2676_t
MLRAPQKRGAGAGAAGGAAKRRKAGGRFNDALSGSDSDSAAEGGAVPTAAGDPAA